MKVPFSWLKEYVDIDCSAYELAEKLLASGFEVEEIIDLSKTVNNIVVGQILSIERHPNADKLQVCTVDCGEHGNAIQIITAAKNIGVNNFVPVALDGSKTANGLEIFTTQMRGETSYGMFCSGEELGLTEELFTGASVDGILILENALSYELKAMTYPVVGGYNFLYSQIGKPIQSLVGLDDYILDISITANRADCQSIYGIAREVAAILKKQVKALDTTYETVYTALENQPKMVATKAGIELCPQYLGQILQGIEHKKSPKWMQRRLALCGMRAKDVAVDITNYILLELGQPLHAFDLDSISEKVVVRRAIDGESVVLLNDKELTLTENQLVIADSEKVLALAGIMGSKVSAVQEETKNIFLECATFNRANIRRSSKALAMRTDASARYEKGVDSHTGVLAMHRALHFFDSLQVAKIVASVSKTTEIETGKHVTGCENLQEDLKILPANRDVSKGIIGGYVDDKYISAIRMIGKTFGYKESLQTTVIQTSYRKINALLGLKLSREKIKSILESLHFTVEEVQGEREYGNIDYKLVGNHLEHSQILVTAPLFREDIEGYADLAEEVIRIYGYENIEDRLLDKAQITQGSVNQVQQFYSKMKALFVGQNYQEIISYSFISPKDYTLFGMQQEIDKSIKIKNPLGEDLSLMRTTLAPSMLQAVLNNIRKNNRDVRLFEFANVYKQSVIEELPYEDKTIAIGLYGEHESFYTAKGVFEAFAKEFALKFEYRVAKYSYLHHGRTAEVLLDGRVIGYLGELAPTIAEELSIECPVYLGELYVNRLEKDCSQRKYFTKLAKFSDIYRDISLVVPKDMTCKEIEEIIYQTDNNISCVNLFDVYFDEKLGQNNKSLAFTITFENLEVEKTPEEIDAIMQKVVENLQQKLGIHRR